MSRYPAATRADHDRFCVVERWVLVRGATGQPVRHHRTYELVLDDGRVLRTRISRPVTKDAYGPSLWSAILRDQLEVTADEFWACVGDGVLPARGPVLPVPPADAVPLGLALQLQQHLGLTDSEIGSMTKDEAVARLHAHWSEGTDPPVHAP